MTEWEVVLAVGLITLIVVGLVIGSLALDRATDVSFCRRNEYSGAKHYAGVAFCVRMDSEGNLVGVPMQQSQGN